MHTYHIIPKNTYPDIDVELLPVFELDYTVSIVLCPKGLL
jgi:hypothetical protein